MYVTKKKLELLRVIHSFRYMPTRSLVRIAMKMKLFSHHQSFYRAIKQLENAGYVDCFYFGFGNAGKVVFITDKASDVLAKYLGISKNEVSAPSKGFKLKYPYLEHSMSLVDIYLKLCGEFEVTKWLGDQMVFFTYQFQNFNTGRTLYGKLSPDGYFEIAYKDTIQRFFLEYDSGTMDRIQLAKKFKRYFEYFVYGDWFERYEVFPGIFFITERKKSEMDMFLQNDIDVEEVIRSWDRKKLRLSNNILYRGMGLSTEINTIQYEKLSEFISKQFIFTFTYESWIEKLREAFL